MPTERRRYIGAYGRKHRTAFVPGVGNLYLNELVDVDRDKNEVRHVASGIKLNDLTADALATLYGDEFVSADTDCTYTLASGAVCEKKRVAGTVYCELHGMLAGVGTPRLVENIPPVESPINEEKLIGELEELNEPIFKEADRVAVKAVDMARRMPKLAIRHICRFCHDDFESSRETDDVCQKCLAQMPVFNDVPSPSDSPQTPPDFRLETPDVLHGDGFSELHDEPPPQDGLQKEADE